MKVIPLLAGLVVCAGIGEARMRAVSSELTVFAAASLSGAFQEIGGRFEQARPGTRVRFNFAGSQQLATQLEQGAIADVFASADQRWMDYAAEKDLLVGEARLFANNRLVVIVPSTNPARIDRLQDLAKRGVKLVVAAEAVPVGAYTRQSLAKLAQDPDFARDFDRRVLANVVSQEENVKAVVTKVQLGEADAGVVYASDAVGSVSRHLRVLPIPDARNVIAGYPIAALKGARAPSAAEQFIRLVLAPEGQSVFKKFGLIPVGAQTGMTLPAASR
jgi:molybdate transport system substrate-binding protein